MEKTQRNINLIFVFLLSFYAIYSIIYQQSSIFFIVYLFWFDELIRNISLYIQIKLHKEDIRIVREFPKAQALNNVKSRFFFLFVYSVFIIILFGLFFHLNKEDSSALVRNIHIFLFQDMPFNICLMISMAREIIQIRTTYLNRITPIPRFSAMSGQLLTLHLSIILGGLLWAITSGKFAQFNFSLGSLNRYAVVLPFFIIKLWVEIYNINSDQKKHLLESLQR